MPQSRRAHGSQRYSLWTACVAKQNTRARVFAPPTQVTACAAWLRGMQAALLVGTGALAGLVPDAAQAQQGPFVYVPNGGDGTVSVIDAPTNAVAPTAIPVGLSPVAAAVRGDELLVYVTKSGGSNTVSVINTATNAVVATIPVGIVPQIVAVSPDGTRAYVANQGSDTVSVINTATIRWSPPSPPEVSLSALGSLPTALASM